MKHWYCLYTKPQGEKLAVMGLERMGLQSYWPLITETTAGSSALQRPLFPCYLFVQVDLDLVRLSAIRWISGVRKIVGFGDQPTPLSDEFITLLQDRLVTLEAAGGLLATKFQLGDRVRVRSGPLQDLEAIFDEPLPGRRVRIMLNILGRLNRVVIDTNALEKISKKPMQSTSKRHRRTRGTGRPIANKKEILDSGTPFPLDSQPANCQ